MSSPRLFCRVCSGPSDYTRFGVASCRSCAEFFKRTVLAGRSFPCRSADGKCVINQKDRHNCRGCRFERCKALGMRLNEQNKEETALVPSGPRPQERKDTLLSLIAKEYSACVARRKICESALLPTSLNPHVKADYAGEDLLLCTWPFVRDCLKMCTGDYINFASACFPEFAALTLDQKRLMLFIFSDRIFAFETIWLSFKKFGTYRGPLYMGTLTTCFDSRKLQFFTEGLEPAVCIALVLCVKVYIDQTNRAIGPLLETSCFTDLEFAAIIALSIWQIDPNQCAPEDIVRLSGAMRGRIFEALDEYYRETMLLTDYSARLGNILLLEQALQNVRGSDGQRSLEFE